MVGKTRRAELGRQGGKKDQQINVRVDIATHAELQAEADELGLTVAAYCRDLIHRQRTGQSLESLRTDIAELVNEQEKQTERIDQLSVGVWETLRTLLLNLTTVGEDDLQELRRRVLGR